MRTKSGVDETRTAGEGGWLQATTALLVHRPKLLSEKSREPSRGTVG